MTYPRRWIALTAVVALWFPPRAWAVDPATHPNPRPDLSLAVDQLGSPDPAVRDEATRLLWAAGKWAEPALREAAEGEGAQLEPEVAARAKALLEKIDSGFRPDTPPQAMEWVVRYKTDSRPVVRIGAAKLLIQMGDPAAPLLLRLWARETDEKIKSEVLRQMLPSCARYARLLMVEGDDATAGQLLEAAAKDRGGQAAIDYAAYLAARGRLAAKIAEFAGPPGDADARERLETAPVKRWLGWLYLANGDVANASRLALVTPDADFRRAVLYAAGDWKGLADAMKAGARQPAAEEPLNAMNLRAALAHLSGDNAQLDDALAQLRRQVELRPQYAFICAETFFAVGRADEAVDLLRPHDPAAAFAFLCFQLHFDEAFALLERAAPAAGKNAAWLHVAAARQRASLGENDKAEASLTAALADAAAEGPQAIAQVNAAAVEVEEAAGLHDRAVERVLAGADDAARATLAAKLFPARSGDGRFWWQALRARPELRSEQPRATLDRLAALLSHKAPPDEARAWCDSAGEAALAERDPHARRQGVTAVADLLRSYGQDGPAAEFLERAARAPGAGPDALLSLGDASAAAGRFDDAARYYERARVLSPPGQPEWALPTYLQGWALAKAGHQDVATPLLELARALPLGTDAARDALCDALEQRGLRKEAVEEGALQMRVQGVWSLGAADAARRAAVDAAERRDFAAAADFVERSLVGVVRQESVFSRQEGYLAVPRAAATYRALAKLKGADPAGIEAAAKELAALVPVLPVDTDWAIRCVAELDRAGRKDLGDALYRDNATLLSGVCEKYPAAATYHNSLAWLAARCGRDLDDALTHARRAVELQPGTTAYLDTLAETHFRRGEKAEAIANMKKCLEAEPTSAYFREQMKRFESGPVSSQPPQK